MKKILLFLSLIPLGGFSQSLLSSTAPKEVGLSADRLARMDDMLNTAVKNGEVPGLVALVARNGKIAYLKAFGKTAEQRDAKTDDIFRIASQTKAITSTAVLMLWEEGKFKLDDPIAKYIPEFEKTGVLDTFNEKDSTFTVRSASKPITIRHLLTHTSGIGYGMIDNDTYRKMYQKAGVIDAFTTFPIALKDNIKILAKMPLHFNPGEKYKYSEGLDVLGYLVEVLSGKPLDVFFKERIFDPLAMTDTYFYLPQSKSARLVNVQVKADNKWIKFKDSAFFDPDYPVNGAKTFFSGGAGLSSTATDYAKFLQMYLNNGMYNGNRLLSRTTIDFMMANQIGDLWASGNEDLGLAFSVVNKIGADKGGLGSEGTFSWGGYFNTQYFADPKEQIIGIIMKQTVEASSDNTSWKFRQLVFQTIND